MYVHIERGAVARSFGNGPTIVCLHGFAENGLMFAPLAQTRAAAGFSFAAPDLPGFGASPPQEDVQTIDQFAEWLNWFVREIEIFGSVGLVAHSAAALIAVRAIERDPELYTGLFSIEGNLTEADAYFSGQAADYESPQAFKSAFLDKVWAMAQRDEAIRRYHAAVAMCDPETMWRFGRDAKVSSAGNAPGISFSSLPIPALYYWSRDSTPEPTRSFIETSHLRTKEFHGASHTPTIDAPVGTGEAIAAFFEEAFASQKKDAAFTA